MYRLFRLSPLRETRCLSVNSFTPSSSQTRRLLLAGVLVDLREEVTLHLWGRINAVEMKHGGSDVKRAGRESHHFVILLDPRSHGDESSRHVVRVGEVVFGNHRCAGVD